MLEVTSPFSGESVARLPYHGSEDVERALNAAHAAQREWAATPREQRCARIEEGRRWFQAHAEEVARDITLQMGKPLSEARAELQTLDGRLEAMLRQAPSALAPDVIQDDAEFVRRIEHLPLGTVLNVAAWNYPLLIAVNVVVPALLAGNAVLLKHSARTPRCGEAFVQAFSGLPRGLLHHLILNHAQTEVLVQDPRVDHVAFTGSVPGGRTVLRAARQRIVDVGLELGGKDPAYVAEDADLPRAVAGVVEGACYNAGQSCCAIERVYVHRRHYDEFLARAQEALGAYRWGDPLHESTTLGPLADSSSLAFLAGQVLQACDRGARLLCGGQVEEGCFFAPTLLADCPQDADVMQEESFGPLLPVAPVDGDEDALAAMNDSRFGLTASVWTGDRERAEWFAERLETGTVFQNRCDYLDPDLPWTGVKDSGRGSTLSRYGFLHLTRRRAIHLRR